MISSPGAYVRTSEMLSKCCRKSRPSSSSCSSGRMYPNLRALMSYDSWRWSWFCSSRIRALMAVWNSSALSSSGNLMVTCSPTNRFCISPTCPCLSLGTSWSRKRFHSCHPATPEKGFCQIRSGHAKRHPCFSGMGRALNSSASEVVMLRRMCPPDERWMRSVSSEASRWEVMWISTISPLSSEAKTSLMRITSSFGLEGLSR
mmetsp:Transcript_9375/g.22218  ORF Transcript_9375/g.22218 Transcript_9375/m.22218 type:complete len:203 (-) Transcript_9375:2125-2733(-)